MGLSPEAFSAAIEAYNAACPPASGPLEPFDLDGLATNGLTPPKTNWARPIVKAPFRAFPLVSAICFTFGGLKVSPDAQVLDNDGRPIPGLYAAGETIGLYHQVYTGATSVLRAAVFGRRSAQHAKATLQV